MAWKLIYTSAPRLLQAGRSGFGTVARHREIPPLVVESAEKSSQFSRQTGLDPARVIFSYRVARSSAGNFHLFTRISDAGTDYSGRTNHLAEHLILIEQEAARLGAEGYTPAGAMLAYEWGGYEGQARWLGDEDLWQPNGADANTGGSHWQAATADANRVNLLASSEAQSGAVLEYPSHYQSEAHPWILWLFAESQCLCPQSGWGITFTTNVQPTDSLSDFRWLGVPDDSPMLQKLQASGRPVFNFATEVPKTFVHTPDAQEPTPISVREGVVRCAASIKHGPDAVRVAPPPKRPTAVEERTRSSWRLYTLLAVLIVALVAAFWWFLPADAPAPPAPPKPSDLSSHENTEEPRVTSISPPKVHGAKVEPTNNEDRATDDIESPELETGIESGSGAVAGSTKQGSSGEDEGEVIRPNRISIIIPDSFAHLKWPEGISWRNLRLAWLDSSGETNILTLNKPITEQDKHYVTEARKLILSVSGKGLPEDRTDNSSYVFEVGKKDALDDIWRIYVLPADKSLKSVVPPNDVLKLDTFTISEKKGDTFLKSTAKDFSVAALLSYIKDESISDRHLGSMELVLEASYTESSYMRDARGQGMVNQETANALRPVRITVDTDGRLDVAAAATPFKELSNTLEKFVNNKPTDILLATRNHLENSLSEIETAVSKKQDSTSQPINAAQHLAAVGENLKPGEMEETLNKLIEGYFKGLQLLLPNDPPTTDGSKDSHYYESQAINSVRNNDLQSAKKNANHFMAQKKLIYGVDLGTALTADRFGAALDEFDRRKDNVATKTQENVAKSIMEDLKKSVSGLLVTPPNAPDLSYTLKLIIDQAEPGPKSAYTEYIITEDIRVVGADGSRSSPAP